MEYKKIMFLNMTIPSFLLRGLLLDCEPPQSDFKDFFKLWILCSSHLPTTYLNLNSLEVLQACQMYFMILFYVYFMI